MGLNERRGKMHTLKIDKSLEQIYLDDFEIKGVKKYQLNVDAEIGRASCRERV